MVTYSINQVTQKTFRKGSILLIFYVNIKYMNEDGIHMNSKKFKKFIFTGLEEKGRLQFFFHSPSSELPVRDILNEQKQGHKTEPHIEIEAENYINCCYQRNNIIPFLESKEKYLFLFTTCKSRKLGKDYYDKRFIVGYIVKEGYIDCDGHYAVRGETKLFSFKDAYPLERLITNSKKIRVKKLDFLETKEILKHFQRCKNILIDCVREIKALEEKNCGKKTCKILRGEDCRFEKNGCLRWSIT